MAPVRHLIRPFFKGLLIAALWAASLPAAASHHETWNLTDLYENQKRWEDDFLATSIKINRLVKLEGSLGRTPQSLLTALNHASNARRHTARLYTYASLIFDQDQRNTTAKARLLKSIELLRSLKVKTAFLAPEIIKIGQSRIEKHIGENKGLQRHAFFLRNILRQAPHRPRFAVKDNFDTLVEVLVNKPNASTLHAGVSITWPSISLSTGEAAILNKAGYAYYRGLNERMDRKRVFDAFWLAVKAHEGAFGTRLNQRLRTLAYNSEARNYSSILENVLAKNNIPTAVYHTLIEAVNANISTLHRYLNLRQRALGIKNMKYYDLHAPSKAQQRTFTLANAKQLTLEALAPFGVLYSRILEDGFKNHWMHPYPRTGKRSGAYMQDAAYDAHPYVLLNFSGRFADVSTFSHEWGHAVHSVLAKRQNPFETAKYSAFTAELASTTNELLLHDYMIAQEQPDSDRLTYIEQALATLQNTFFRQAQFAEFELRIHDMVEAGNILTGPMITQTYLKILQKYYGHHLGIMKIDPAYAVEWALIPPMNKSFNAYQYATSIAGGTLFAEQIQSGNTTARDSYLSVLKAGGSEHPYQLLKAAGIDLATVTPYTSLFRRMNRLMDEMSVLLDNAGK